MLKTIFVAALFVLSTVVRGSATEPRCVEYEPHVVSLDGLVIYRTFADANGRPERSPLLLLDDPICVHGSAGEDLNVDEYDQIIIHLNMDARSSAGRTPSRVGASSPRGRSITAIPRIITLRSC